MAKQLLSVLNKMMSDNMELPHEFSVIMANINRMKEGDSENLKQETRQFIKLCKKYNLDQYITYVCKNGTSSLTAPQKTRDANFFINHLKKKDAGIAEEMRAEAIAQKVLRPDGNDYSTVKNDNEDNEDNEDYEEVNEALHGKKEIPTAHTDPDIFSGEYSRPLRRHVYFPEEGLEHIRPIELRSSKPDASLPRTTVSGSFDLLEDAGRTGATSTGRPIMKSSTPVSPTTEPVVSKTVDEILRNAQSVGAAAAAAIRQSGVRPGSKDDSLSVTRFDPSSVTEFAPSIVPRSGYTSSSVPSIVPRPGYDPSSVPRYVHPDDDPFSGIIGSTAPTSSYAPDSPSVHSIVPSSASDLFADNPFNWSAPLGNRTLPQSGGGNSNNPLLPHYVPKPDMILRLKALNANSKKNVSVMDDASNVSGLIRKLVNLPTDKASDKIGNSTWLYSATDPKMLHTLDERKGKESWTSTKWGDKCLVKCIQRGSKKDLCECIAQINDFDDDDDMVSFVHSLTPNELQILFKLFNVPLHRVDGVLVPIKASIWKNNFKCASENPNVITFITYCIELCSNPSNYLLLNTEDEIDCYKKIIDARKKRECDTLRTKPVRDAARYPLCPPQIYAPTKAFFQIGGNVNYVKHNSTIGKFLMNGGRITKQSGGAIDNACCANALEESLKAVVNQLKSQGKRVDSQDLELLEEDIKTMGEIEAGLRTLIEKKLKIYSYSLGSRNCRPGDDAEALSLHDIMVDDSIMMDNLKKDYELCTKQIQCDTNQYNQLLSQITNNLNTLQFSQPLIGPGF
jgi:hypothetical protein